MPNFSFYKLSCFVLLALASSAFAQKAEPTAESLAGKRVVFLGDSITQGGAYVSFAAYYLEKLHPRKRFEIFGLGLSSETLSGLSEKNHAGGRFPRPCLFERLGRLLEKVKPEIVFACYGMNDGIYQPLEETRFQAFKDGVTKLIEQCQAAGVKRIYLITPPSYCFPRITKGFNYDTVLAAYAEWETALNKPGVRVIDLHTPMSQAGDGVFSRYRVHPAEDGHLFMAKTILSAIGATPTDEPLATIKADPLYQQVNALRRLRSDRWRRHVGYTREKTVKPQPLGDTEAEAAKIREKIDALK